MKISLSERRPARRFNSLQTGKRIQRDKTEKKQPPKTLVSIPFKRESVSKAVVLERLRRTTSCFNSLQTGKRIQSGWGDFFSIKFNQKVSIPFKRESVSKVNTTTPRKELSESFNSLQTGKRIQRAKERTLKLSRVLKFQFPSNGKAYPKRLATGRCRSSCSLVSIPFKRESVSKVKSRIKYQKPKKAVVSIPFKRESVSKVILQPPLFQWLYTRFNSLQTGKRIQRRLTMSAFSSDLFKVSIPFKRESVSKVTKRENLL